MTEGYILFAVIAIAFIVGITIFLCDVKRRKENGADKWVENPWGESPWD